MDDLISRSALIAYVKELPTYDPTDSGFIFKRYPSGLFAPDDIVKSIQNAPAVDAEEVVRCDQCLYRSQYANEEGLYKCGAITCKEGHCAMVAPCFSCIAGKKRGKDDG